jgi:predicted 2-oxoglutarate/Fe(II)-dependent dioxygenase YbiX
MIIELPKFVSQEDVAAIRDGVGAFLPDISTCTYNRDGKSVFITKVPELKEIDTLISKNMVCLQTEVVANRFKPAFPSGDSGYEYHLYAPGEICHHHADGEISNGLLRYATVIIFLTDNKGGELVFPSQNQEIKPQAGKVVVFPPYGTHGHYSKPATTNREIVMTWFVYSGIKVSGI